MGFRRIIIPAAVPAALAFVLVMERPVALTIDDLDDRFGSSVVEEDIELTCLCCANDRQARVKNWKMLGQHGSSTLHHSDTLSRFSADFPEFHCGHYWVPRGEQSLDPSLCGPAWGFGRRYSQESPLRERIRDELSVGRLNRQAVIKRVEGEWFEDLSPEQALIDEIESRESEPLVTGLRLR